MRLLMRFMRPYRGLIAVTLFAVLIDNVGTLLVPTMLANMVNTGITTGDVDYILRNGLYMLIATGMASGGTVLGCYLSARLAANVACDIRNAVYDKSLELSASDFERFGTGSMITRSLNDINVIQQAVLQTIQLVLPVPFLAVAGIIFAWFIDPAMGTLLGVVVAIVLVAAVFTVANAAPIFMRLQSFIDRMNVVLRENIVGVRVIRAFNKERHEEQRLDEVFSDYAANAIKVNHLFVGLDSSSFFLMNIAEVAVLWVGGNRVGVHAMQIGSISAVLEYAILILFFVMTAQMVILTLPRAAACLNRAQQVLEIEPSIVDGKRTLDTCAAESVDGADAVAVFDHMSFRFDDADEDTLCDLSFACRRSQTTAIVGSTGSGKSTVAKLLLRFHDATKGAIRLNGIDLRDLSQDEIRGRIAYVPQVHREAFAYSVEDVVLMGRMPYHGLFTTYNEQDRQVGAQLDSLERSFNRIVVVAEHLPEISDKVLEELNRQATQLIWTMNASVDNAFADFDRQRGELQQYVTREREALVEQLALQDEFEPIPVGSAGEAIENAKKMKG